MNWLIKYAAIALFFSTLLFTSCDDDPTSIGLELQEPGSQIGAAFSDTTEIEASTVLLKDSIITLGSTQVQVGRITDGAFGTTTVNTFAELALPSAGLTFSANSGADSMVLHLDYSYYYGDTTKAVTWNVHRLQQGFIDQETYYTTKSFPYESSPVGSVTFTPRPNGKYRTITGTDTTYSSVLINVKLSSGLANEFLAQSGKTALSTQAQFIEFFKGLAIVPAPGSEGTVLGIALASSNVTLYYTSTADNTKKSNVFNFSGRHINQVQSDRTGTPLAALMNQSDLLPSTATQNFTYLQAGTGLVTKINIPNILQYRKDQNSPLLVNKAELLIPVQPGSYTNRFRLPGNITVVEAKGNTLARTSGVPNALTQELGTGAATLAFDSVRSSYTVDVTSYVLNVLYNRRENTGLILLPSNVSSDLATPTNNAQQVNRAILNAEPEDASGALARRIRLRLYYSKAQ